MSSMKKKQYYNLLISTIFCMVFEHVSSNDQVLNTVFKADSTFIPECVLCAACDPDHALRNKSNDICTLPEHVQYLSTDSKKFVTKTECYKLGDFSELISSEQNTTHVSILPPSKKKPFCKFNISFYDVMKGNFIQDDVLFAKFGTSKLFRGNMTSLNGRWKVVHKKNLRWTTIYKTQNFKFDIISLTGKK